MKTAVWISARSHQALKALAAATGQSIGSALERAIDELRRRIYLEGAADDYARLKRDSKAWSDFGEELALWERTNGDGLERKRE